jgi:hypothetical protein
MRNVVIILITFLFLGCKTEQKPMTKIIFLHHSTGQAIWNGSTNRYIRKLTNKSEVKSYFNNYNRKNKANYLITEQSFPKDKPNYPFDYYNIWVKNAGEHPYMDDPTLEMLTKEYDLIIFKHCFPVSLIQEDTGNPNIDSSEKRIENYKLQYSALKTKMREFPGSKFILWTPAVHVKNNISYEEALRTNEIHKWLMNEWDEKGDNIFLWDFYMYETEGGLYMLDKYARAVDDSHPNRDFAGRVAPLFSQFIIDVAEGRVD